MAVAEEKLAHVPTASGCYLWLETADGESRVLYVGKAKNLKNRIRQYLRSEDTKTRFLMSRANDLEWMVTATESEALLLENNLIKKHNPIYNIRLKDDKRYPYLCLTTGEDFPRLIITRKKLNRRHSYFGPFSDAGAARSVYALVQRIFPVRKRPLKLPLRQPARPCLNYHMGACLAPCADYVSREEYRKMTDSIADFLSGRTGDVREKLESDMKKNAAEMKFEQAAALREIIADLDRVTGENQQVHGEADDSNFDMVAAALKSRPELRQLLGTGGAFLDHSREDWFAQIVLLKIRHGNLISKQTFAVQEGFSESPEAAEHASAILSGFLRDYYLAIADVPAWIYLSDAIRDENDWQQALSRQAGKNIRLITAAAGKNLTDQRKSLMRMAMQNAELSLRERVLSEKIRNEKFGLRQLQKMLNLKDLPVRIECYDISNIQGSEPVASGVMLKDGIPFKSGYRKYRIRAEESPNDPLMMAEVIGRRLRYLSTHPEERPDLIVVDGGITQLNAALSERSKTRFQIPMIGLAKQEEEIYTENGEILDPDQNSPGMLLLRRARDEAHRFAVAYHRNLRMKRNLRSRLDGIRGVGEKTRALLMNELRKADLSEGEDALVKRLAALPGISEKRAREIAALFSDGTGS